MPLRSRLAAPQNPKSSLAFIGVEVPDEEPHSIARERFEELRRRLRLEDAAEQKLDGRLVYRKGGDELEYFYRSGSFRWTKRGKGEGEKEKQRDPTQSIPVRPARALCKGAVEELGLADDHMQLAAIERTMRIQGTRKRQTKPHTIALHVRYRFAIDGVPVVGPGAKTVVTVGSQGDITRFYKFWRPLSRARGTAPRSEGPVRPTRDIAARLLAHESLAKLDRRIAKLNLERPILAYYAAPPRELQRWLVPVFVVRGEAELRGLTDPLPFVQYVLAVDLQQVALDAAVKPLVIE